MPKRVDENQRQIVGVLRSIGASVQVLSDVGKGFPDLVVGFRGVNYLVEVKNGKRPKSGQKLTPKEQVFFDNWNGQVCIVTCSDEAINLLNNQ